MSPHETEILPLSGAQACVPPTAEPLTMPMALLLLAKPGIVAAEMLAGVAGALLASPSASAADLCLLLLLLALGAGGAAMANCLMEEESDKRMQRLARRCRALEVAGRGLVFCLAALFTLAAAAIALLYFTPLATMLLLAASSIYIAIYTGWLKRRTPWSLLAGGIPGALPPLIGAAAVGWGLTTAAFLLALIIYLWQLPHFLFLALHCRNQYLLAGIPVLPATHGVEATRRLTLGASLALIPVSGIFCLVAGHGHGITAFYLGLAISFSLCSYHLLYRKRGYRLGFNLSLAYMTILLIAVICGTISGASG